MSAKTQQFLSGLRDDEVALLEDGLRLVRSIQTVSKFLRWVALFIAGGVVASVGLAESIMKIVSWFRGAKP